MKAMGQLEIGNEPPTILNSAPKVVVSNSRYADPPSNVPPNYPMNQNNSRSNEHNARQDSQLVPTGDRTREREREMTSPARRKGGAIQNLYNDEENLRRKFASQHEYSDQLHRQVGVLFRFFVLLVQI